MLPEATRVFLEGTSIRGVSKIFKSQSRFLSRLWALFVFGSTSLLFYSAFQVTMDYLQYDVNIQTHLDLDDVSPFPAVSVCNNQPFSENAYRVWAADAVASPTRFNRDLRQRGLQLMNETEIVELYAKLQLMNETEIVELYAKLVDPGHAKADAAAQFLRVENASKRALQLTLPMDSSRLYFQNLNASQAEQLGHERNDSFVDCIFKYGSTQVQGTRGCYDDMISVTKFSHPNYFNCFTLQFNEARIKDVFSLALIIWLGPDENYGIKHRQGFLYDIFEQAYGLRVAVHEPGSHPRILEQGIQTEPGKMNEIKYQASRFVRAATPRSPCLSEPVAKSRKFADHGQLYDYDQELCLNTKVQEAFQRSCGCLYVELPLLHQTNASRPYCGYMDDRLFDRLACARTIDQRRLRQQSEGSECLPRCTELSYHKELSVTKWRDTRWMLHWIREVSERWNTYLMNLYLRKVTAGTFRRDLNHLREYFSMNNITDPALHGNDTNFHFDERYTYVMVKRRANNTLVQQERIVLTVNALFSRIGGLCSMYIGLTLAFFVECVELVYGLVFIKQPRADGQPADVARKCRGLDVTDTTEQMDLVQSVSSAQDDFNVWIRRTDVDGTST